MAIRIGSTNIGTLRAQRQLARSSDSLARVYEQLSSGKRINRASDDAAGLAITEQLNSTSRVLGQALRNINDAYSLMNIADSALESLQSIVSRQTELASQAANGTFSTQQREALNTEYGALTQEFRRVIESTQFNGINPFQNGQGTLNVQVGNDSIQTILDGEHSASTSYTQDITLPIAKSIMRPEFVSKDINGDGISDLIALGIHADGTGQEARFVASTLLGNASGSGYSINSSFSQVITAQYQGPRPADITASSVGNGLRISVDVNSNAGLVGYTRDVLIDSTGTITGFNIPFVQPGPKPEDEAQAGNISIDLNGDGLMDQVSSKSNNSLTISIAEGLSSDSVYNQSISNGLAVLEITDISTQMAARTAIEQLAGVAQLVSAARSRVGVGEVRLHTAERVTGARQLEYRTAAERISAADLASSTAEAVRLRILQQTAETVMSQSNLDSRIVLRLLEN